MKNLNLLFNKTYYRNLGNKKAFEQDCQMFNHEICDVTFDKSRDYLAPFLPADRMQTVELVTTYPGMLVGTGYAHGTGDCDDDVNIGFSFDYVTGQPYVPGSSVKGLLRCVFREQPDAAAEIVRVCTGKELTTEQIRELEEKIFDSGDVFLDAVVCQGAVGGRLMGLDNITPHSEPTKNPIPILLLKILPGVHFEFRFALKNEAILTAAEKTEIFRKMLILFGAGARTNVGYGQLVTPQEYAKLTPVVRNAIPVTDGNRPNSGNNHGNNYSTPNAHRPQTAQTANADKVRCPHCGKMSWARYPDGNPRKTCSFCKEKLS